MTFRDLYGPGINIESGIDPVKKQQKLSMLASEALEIVNTIRTVLLIGEGKLESLPAGYLRDAHSCVLAVALSNGWRSQVAEYIYLVHEPDGTVNFDDVKVALEERGFLNVSLLTQEPKWDDSLEMYDYDNLQTCGVKFDCPVIMSQFFTKFDSGYYPDLILNDNSPKDSAKRRAFVKQYTDITNGDD